MRRTLTTLFALGFSACAPVPPPAGEVTMPPPASGQAAPMAPSAPTRASLPWAPPWRVVEAFKGATVVFGHGAGLCASGPDRTRCLEDQKLGPVATSVLTSPTDVWGFTYICGVGPGGAFLCNVPSADRPQQGPPRLEHLVSVAVHAAAHTDGSLSVTANTSAMGYADPQWTKVDGVNDAVEVASSWYASRSCFRRRSGEVACVKHARDAVPKAVDGVKNAARIWKTDQALWVLTRDGELLASRTLSGPMSHVANDIVDLAPIAAAPTAAVGDPKKGSENPEVPCAVTRDGRLLCGLARSWELSAVPGAGTSRAVFGGSDWICAVDDAGTTRCVLPVSHPD